MTWTGTITTSSSGTTLTLAQPIGGSRRPGERPRAEVNNITIWQPHNHQEIRTANRGDRGWIRPESRPVTPSRPEPRPAQQRVTPTPPVRRPNPSVVQSPAEITRSRPASGALIGVQSSHQTQQFSNRGQQSRQTISRPAQPARPAASPRPVPPARTESPNRSPGNSGKR